MRHGTMDRREMMILLAGAASAGLAGCTTEVRQGRWPDIDFLQHRPVLLDVSAVEYLNAAPGVAVEPPARDLRHVLPLSPDSVMRRWTEQRLQPVGAGSDAVARVTVTEMSFIEVPLETTDDLEGLFTIDQSERYDAALAARIEIVGDPRGSGFAEARAAASRTVPEDHSLDQREQVLHDMMRDVFAALDERMEHEIRGNLSRWVMAP